MKHLRQYIRQTLIEAAGVSGAPYFSPPQVFKDETDIDMVHRYKLPQRFSSGKALQDWTDANEPGDPIPVDINDFYGPLVDELIKLNPELAPLHNVGKVEEWDLLPDQEMSEVYPWHLKDIVIGVASEFPPADLLYFWNGGERGRDISWEIGTQIEKQIGVRPQWMLSPETAAKHFDLQEQRIRGYIRQVLLTEAAKTPDLLPDDIVIWIDDEEGYDEVTIIYAEKAIPFRRMMPIGKPGDGISDKTGYPIWGRIVIEKTEDYGLCDGAMKVAVSRAADGWGPLLYDVAIEYATQVANGLMPDRTSVSRQAQRVWKYYMNNRGDVKSHTLDNLNNDLTDKTEDNCNQRVAEEDEWDWWHSPLSRRFTKEPTTIKSLKATGKLVTTL